MIKYQQSQALTSHFESFWSIVFTYLRFESSLNTSSITVLISGNKLINLTYVVNNRALVPCEHKWYLEWRSRNCTSGADLASPAIKLPNSPKMRKKKYFHTIIGFHICTDLGSLIGIFDCGYSTVWK